MGHLTGWAKSERTDVTTPTRETPRCKVRFLNENNVSSAIAISRMLFVILKASSHACVPEFVPYDAPMAIYLYKRENSASLRVTQVTNGRSRDCDQVIELT